MRRVLPLALLCLLAVPANAREKQLPPRHANAMATSVNAFAVDLFKAMKGDGNLFFSPYSISAALGMTRAGARGETAAEMDAVLHYPESLAIHQRALVDALKPRQIREYDDEGKPKLVPAYELNVANALWGQKGFAFLPDFLETMKTDYRAPLFRIDFQQQELARKTINEWVEKQTKDKIQNIVPPGSPPRNAFLVLANAIYFKGGWIEPFSESRTKHRPWHRLDGSQEKSALMRRVDHFRYTEDDDVQVAELAYRGNDTSMVVILPKKKDGLIAVEKALTAERLATWMGGLRRQRLDLSLPKWKFTYTRELSRVLKKMGMKHALGEGMPDFSGITDQAQLGIGMILHKAYIGVDEEGTEAAAATVIIMPTGAVERPSTPKPFVADHPFLYVIRHRKTGAILFMGRLLDPKVKEG
ncbi:MAG: serpin family protein [Planctomycetota bacterium]|nr:serpin family protein [Planctomycetota bacterium]